MLYDLKVMVMFILFLLISAIVMTMGHALVCVWRGGVFQTRRLFSLGLFSKSVFKPTSCRMKFYTRSSMRLRNVNGKFEVREIRRISSKIF